MNERIADFHLKRMPRPLSPPRPMPPASSSSPPPPHSAAGGTGCAAVVVLPARALFMHLYHVASRTLQLRQRGFDGRIDHTESSIQSSRTNLLNECLKHGTAVTTARFQSSRRTVTLVTCHLQAALPPLLWLGSEQFGILNRFRFRIWFLAAPHARAGCAPGSHTPRSQHYREHHSAGERHGSRRRRLRRC